MNERALARQLAQDSLDQGKPLDWFETLYRTADGDDRVIPWADQVANPNLVSWLDEQDFAAGSRALVIGCGLGDDAEALSRLGLDTTAFDISPTCVEWCRRRFPESSVNYCVADVLAPPAAWEQAFDLVVEIYTLQVLPPDLQAKAARQMASCVAPGGSLLVIARGREPDEDPGKMPWPLTRADLTPLLTAGLTEHRFDDYIDVEDPPVRRFRVHYRRA